MRLKERMNFVGEIKKEWWQRRNLNKILGGEVNKKILNSTKIVNQYNQKS